MIFHQQIEMSQRRRRRSPERGVTMLMVMTVLGTLLLATAIGIGTRYASMQTTSRTLENQRATQCADAGLAAGRDFFIQNAANWSRYIQTGYVITGQANPRRPDLIYIVGMSDDYDEPPPAINNPLQDNNQTVLIRSTCTDVRGEQYAMRERYLTLTPLRRGGNLRIRPGQVTYTSTEDFTNHGAIPDCNGCGLIGQDGEGSASTTGGGALGNQGIVALGVKMVNDRITLAERTGYPFLWLPGSGEGTISKYNTGTGQEIARYRTASKYGNPSRTTVDLNGNVWVSNRNIPAGSDFPTITKIGLFEADQCVDRNNDGRITTSRGPTDLKDWKGEWGTFDLAEDECILLHVPLRHPDATTPSDARMLAVDCENNLYAGGLTSPAVYHIRGTDGAILNARNTLQGHYGGVLSRDGFLWSMHVGSGRVEKIKPDLSHSWLYSIGHPGYGITIDIYGRIWTSSWTPAFSRMDSDGTHLKVFRQVADGGSSNPQVGCCAQGITTNGNGDVLLAGSLSSNHVGHYRNDGSFVKNYIVGTGPTGVVIDAANMVWAAGYTSQQIARINPETGDMKTYNSGVRSYTYSDATGYTVRTITSPQGTWTVTQYCGNNCRSWAQIMWNADTPSGTTIQVRARAAASTGALQLANWQKVENGESFPANGPDSLRGPLLQVEVKLTTADPGRSPTFYDLTLIPRR